MFKKMIVPTALVAMFGVVTLALRDREIQPMYTVDFGLSAAGSSLVRTLVADGRNTYMSLEPGTIHRYAGEDDGKNAHVDQRVLDESLTFTLNLNGRWLHVNARVVEEHDWIDGKLSEHSYKYFARDPETNNIYFLGEVVDVYEDGQIVSNEGSWFAGKNGARPGLYMPGSFLLGARYHVEYAPDVAMGRAEHVAMGLRVELDLATFDDCVATRETDPIDPDEEVIKTYAPQVGLIADGPMLLVEYVPAR